MKPGNHATDAMTSLDELVETQLRNLSEKLARPHSLEELEREVTILNELVQSFKFRDELLKRLADDDLPAAPRRQAREAVARHVEIVRQNRRRSSELISKSHRLIEKSERLFARLAIERPMASSSLSHQRNLLLAALPAGEYTSLISRLERVSISMGRIVCHPSEPIRCVYFPETAIFSVVAVMKNGSTVEVGTVGKEGMVGIRVLFGADATPAQTVAQVAGTALRMSVSSLGEVIRSGGSLESLLLLYSQAALTQARQSAACKNFHSVERRLAKWLLTVVDYMESDQVALTQSRIAQVIGSRVAGVSEAASRLQKEGLISYSRGSIKILDRPALEAAACECYQVLRRELEQLYLAYSRLAQETARSEA
ncbi:MAG TPA: Crp/Fnr family transcriptional regulator [Blastocatellia bacterium]|nr:Crp/Fnr family transcriptional regulator [Blastocatellia bacterium]